MPAQAYMAGFFVMYRDFAVDIMTLSSSSFIEFSNHQDCHGVNF